MGGKGKTRNFLKWSSKFKKNPRGQRQLPFVLQLIQIPPNPDDMVEDGSDYFASSLHSTWHPSTRARTIRNGLFQLEAYDHTTKSWNQYKGDKEVCLFRRAWGAQRLLPLFLHASIVDSKVVSALLWKKEAGVDQFKGVWAGELGWEMDKWNLLL